MFARTYSQPYKEHVRLLSRHLASYDFEVTLAVRMHGLVTSTVKEKEEEEEDQEEMLAQMRGRLEALKS